MAEEEAEADADALTLEILKYTLKHYEELEISGSGDLGTQALIKHYERE